MAGADLVAIAFFEFFDDKEDMFLPMLEELVKPKKDLESLERIAEDECWAKFRLKKEEMERLLNVVQIPDKAVCPDGTIADGMEVLCMLRRMAYPCRLSDFLLKFRRSAPGLGHITCETIEHISNRFGNTYPV